MRLLQQHSLLIRWVVPLAGLSLLALAAPTRAAEPPADYAARWPDFVVMVWQYLTPPPGPEAKRLYESVNLHGIHLDNGFPDALYRFAVENNSPYYVDHAAGKGDLYLKKEEWNAFIAEYKRTRRRPQRPRSLFDPAVIARMKARLDENIGRAKGGPVVAYAFDDEISTTSFTSPADLDWSPAALAAFRGWLREQYATIAHLNAEWGTQYAAFDEAEPQGVDDLLGNHARPFPQWNLSRWADHRTFMDTQFASVLADLREHANRLDPRTPAGFVGGQAPAAYGGYDYARLARAVQWMEAYDIGGTDEILRSFWGQERPHVQTFFSSGRPHLDKWFLWHYLAHGDRGAIAWPERDGKSWFAGGAVASNIQALSDTFKEVQGPLGSLLSRARFQDDGIAVYYSHPSIQVSWFMDIQPHGRTWVNRSSSMNNGNATDILNRVAWTKWLEDCGYQYTFVSYLDVRERGLGPNRYRVLILPRVLAMSDAEAEAIRRYVRAGGTVIADYLPGVFDEHGKGREKGALDDLFGVQRDPTAGVLNGKTVAEVNAERYDRPLSERLQYDGALRWWNLAMYERALVPTAGADPNARTDNAAVVIRRREGRGRAIYLNLSPIDHLIRRGGDDSDQRALLTDLLHGAGLHPPRLRVLSGDAEVPTCERLFWERDGRTYVFVVKNPVRDAKIDGMGTTAGVPDTGAIPIRLEFGWPVRGLRNERTGKALGDGLRFDEQWVPCEAGVWSYVAEPTPQYVYAPTW